MSKDSIAGEEGYVGREAAIEALSMALQEARDIRGTINWADREALQTAG